MVLAPRQNGDLPCGEQLNVGEGLRVEDLAIEVKRGQLADKVARDHLAACYEMLQLQHRRQGTAHLVRGWRGGETGEGQEWWRKGVRGLRLPCLCFLTWRRVATSTPVYCGVREIGVEKKKNGECHHVRSTAFRGEFSTAFVPLLILHTPLNTGHAATPFHLLPLRLGKEGPLKGSL